MGIQQERLDEKPEDERPPLMKYFNLFRTENQIRSWTLSLTRSPCYAVFIRRPGACQRACELLVTVQPPDAPYLTDVVVQVTVKSIA
jgi:hypothetical protein